MTFTSKTAEVADDIRSNARVGDTVWVSGMLNLLSSLPQRGKASCSAPQSAAGGSAAGSSNDSEKVKASLIAALQKVNSEVFPTLSASKDGMFSLDKHDANSEPQAKRKCLEFS